MVAKKLSLITIAVPVRNEEGNLPELFRRLTSVIDSLPEFEFEILQIDNGSTDASSQLCRQFAAKDDRWKYIQFSRNFGIESSFLAGTTYASGDALIYLFSDLQDPPELIVDMLKKWKDGYDVVYGELQKRSDGNIVKSFGAKAAYYLIYWLSEIKIPINATDYRLISRSVIDAVNQCPERNRYMRGLVQWAGFSQYAIPFERVPRVHGKSSAGLRFCFNYALNAITSFSTKPLKLASIIGLIATAASVFGSIFWIAITVLSRNGMISITPPPLGWTTMTLLIFFFGGIQCLFMGIMGEYLAGVHSETKRRPPWCIRSTQGINVRSASKDSAEFAAIPRPRGEQQLYHEV
jgi:glycosyltransferase involved in cell wall biosynthesis